MSASRDSGVTSKLEDDKSSVLGDLNRSRMEIQWLKWERDRLSAELEAVRKGSLPEAESEVYIPKGRDIPHVSEVYTPKGKDIPRVKVDCEVDWRLPGDTSGYASLKARDRSSIGTSPELVTRESRQSGSIPQRRSTPAPVVSPCAKPFVKDDGDSGRNESHIVSCLVLKPVQR